MSHNPKAEKAAGIPHNQPQRYGAGANKNPTKAPPRTAPKIDTATQGVNGGPGKGQSSGVGKGMKGR